MRVSSGIRTNPCKLIPTRFVQRLWRLVWDRGGCGCTRGAWACSLNRVSCSSPDSIPIQDPLLPWSSRSFVGFQSFGRPIRPHSFSIFVGVNTKRYICYRDHIANPVLDISDPLTIALKLNPPTGLGHLRPLQSLYKATLHPYNLLSALLLGRFHIQPLFFRLPISSI